MPSINGHGPKRAILYARVSTEEQARSGYSLAQQMEALREYAAREGYEVLEEVADPGHSGASLERPGMDRVRDLVAAGSVSVVLAQDRDRFAREPAYHYLLKRDFEEHGTIIRALNDRGDGSPEGQLTDGILDQLAKYERAKLAERSRRGKLRKAREGKVVAGAVPNFGFKYNVSRDNYVVDERTIQIVRRIFHMVGLERRALNSVKRALEAEGVTTPTGNRYWRTRSIRSIILDDVYRPHAYEEIEALTTPEVVGRLDPNENYGIWWFNRERISRQQVAESSPNGRIYREKVKATARPREEWIAVPVPDSRIPLEMVNAARKSIADNRRTSSNGDRFWELSGGILHCSACGLRMKTNVTRKATKRYYYYICKKHYEDQDTCPNGKNYRADKLETAVWELVSELLQNPEQLRADLEEMIEREREDTRGKPHHETKVWLEKLAEVDRMRSGYQEMAAKGLMTFEELGAMLEELANTRSIATRELEVLRSHRERIEGLERDKDALLESYAGMVPQALGGLTPEERHQVYTMLRVEVDVDANGRVEVTGALRADSEVCNSESARLRRTGRPCRSTPATSSASRTSVSVSSSLATASW